MKRILGVAAVCLLGMSMSARAQFPAMLFHQSDDSAWYYVNGTEVQLDWIDTAIDTNVTRWGGKEFMESIVNLRPGKNVIGVKVWDGGWTGGFCAAINLNNVGIPETLITDTSWRCTFVEPTDNAWASDTNFDASSWLVPGDHHEVSATGVLAAGQLYAENLLALNPHWLWTPKTTYMRKAFTTTTRKDTMLALLRGYAVRNVHVYLDGVEIMTHPGSLELGWPWPTDSAYVIPLDTGSHVVAISYDEDSTSCGGLRFGLLGTRTGPSSWDVAVFTDTTWKWTFDPGAGWAGTNYDDAAWRDHMANSFFDFYTQPFPDGDLWHATSTMYFRKVFYLDPDNVAVRGARVAAKAAPAKVVRREYFDLRGARVPAANVKTLARGVVLIERRTIGDSRTVSGKLTVR